MNTQGKFTIPSNTHITEQDTTIKQHNTTQPHVILLLSVQSVVLLWYFLLCPTSCILFPSGLPSVLSRIPSTSSLLLFTILLSCHQSYVTVPPILFVHPCSLAFCSGLCHPALFPSPHFLYSSALSFLSLRGSLCYLLCSACPCHYLYSVLFSLCHVYPECIPLLAMQLSDIFCSHHCLFFLTLVLATLCPRLPSLASALPVPSWPHPELTWLDWQHNEMGWRYDNAMCTVHTSHTVLLSFVVCQVKAYLFCWSESHTKQERW